MPNKKSAHRTLNRRAFLLSTGAANLSLSSGFASDNGVTLEHKLKSWLADIVEKGWVSGGSVYVTYGNETPLYVIHGKADIESRVPLNIDTIYRIYSMTKPITAATMMTLVESGTVTLDQPIADFLPEFSNPQVFVKFNGDDIVTEPAKRPITIRHLLTHTAGLSASFNKEIEPTAKLYLKAGLATGQWYDKLNIRTLSALTKKIAQIPLAAQPGEQWIYGSSLDVAGRVIEVASDMEFSKYMKEKILAPLKMHDTSFSPPANKNRLAALYANYNGTTLRMPPRLIPQWGEDPVVPAGGAGLFSTLLDYSQFIRMLLNKGELDGARVLSTKTIELMMTNQLGSDFGDTPLSSAARFGLGGEYQGLGFGLGGSVMRSPEQANGIGSKGEYAWGGAASTTFWVDPAQRLGVTFMTQKLPSGAHPLRDQLRRIIYNHLA